MTIYQEYTFRVTMKKNNATLILEGVKVEIPLEETPDYDNKTRIGDAAYRVMQDMLDIDILGWECVENEME